MMVWRSRGKWKCILRVGNLQRGQKKCPRLRELAPAARGGITQPTYNIGQYFLAISLQLYVLQRVPFRTGKRSDDWKFRSGKRTADWKLRFVKSSSIFPFCY